MKKEYKEIIELEKELDNTLKLMLPMAFFVTSILMFISFLIGRNKFSWFATMIGLLGLVMCIYELKDRKKKEIRLEKLYKEVDEEDKE